MAEAPRLLDRLAPEDAEHFAAVRALLDAAGLAVRDRPDARARARLLHAHGVRVRVASALGAQAALGGGGRYDGLIEELGGPPTPGVGWAAGVERILLAAGEAEADRRRRRVRRVAGDRLVTRSCSSGSFAAAACAPRWSRPAAR